MIFKSYEKPQTFIFAGQSISLAPNSAKLIITMTNWTFKNNDNKLYMRCRICEKERNGGLCVLPFKENNEGHTIELSSSTSSEVSFLLSFFSLSPLSLSPFLSFLSFFPYLLSLFPLFPLFPLSPFSSFLAFFASSLCSLCSLSLTC